MGPVTRDDRGGGVLGPLEAEVMDAVWRSKTPLSVRQVLTQLNKGRRNPLAYTTVMTVMGRLTDKEILHRQLEGRGYVYEAGPSSEAAIAVHGVLRDFGDAAVASLVDAARADPKLLRRLERLMREET